MVCPWVLETGHVTLLGRSAQLCSWFEHSVWTSTLERRTVGGQRQHVLQAPALRVWWYEDGTRPVPGAPSLGGRYVANTADVSCTPLAVLVPGWAETLGLSRPH